MQDSRARYWLEPLATLGGVLLQLIEIQGRTPVGFLTMKLAFPPNAGCQHRRSRACQIFYQLKGGTVCYGEEHSRSHGHACHGETYEVGSFADWGEDNPVHLIGHIFGGQTARVLQHLIATGEGDSSFFSKPAVLRVELFLRLHTAFQSLHISSWRS